MLQLYNLLFISLFLLSFCVIPQLLSENVLFEKCYSVLCSSQWSLSGEFCVLVNIHDS